MENLIKFLEDKITDKMSVEEIVDVFEQMCSTPLEEDMVLFETGTFTAFSKEPFFQISLVRQFSNDDEEFYQIHVPMWVALWQTCNTGRTLSTRICKSSRT